MDANRYEQQAEQFIKANPTVWRDIVIAASTLAQQRKRFGMKAIVEWARFNWLIKTTHAQGFKFNNNHTAYLARRLVREAPECRGFIKFRETRARA